MFWAKKILVSTYLLLLTRYVNHDPMHLNIFDINVYIYPIILKWFCCIFSKKKKIENGFC